MKGCLFATVLGVVLIFAAIIYGLSAVKHVYTAQEEFPAISTQDLRCLWLAGLNYAKDHDGKFPATMDDLLKDDLYKTLVPSARAKLKKRTTYLGAGILYRENDEKTLFAKYAWPEVGEATISVSGKTTVIVYGKPELNQQSQN